VRVPAHPGLRRLLARTGPLTGTSANRSGAPPARTARAVEVSLGAAIDVLVDGGETPGGLPSTIVDARIDPPALLRPGAYPWPETR
jgi:L-threonylcarbamoyladenylate synthase